MVEISYCINIGGAGAAGIVSVDTTASDEDIRAAIMDDLDSVEYDKIIEDGEMRVTYVIDVGSGCAEGEIVVNIDATNTEILAAISEDLDSVEYETK